MITEEFRQLADNVKKYLENESSGHDFYHSERVFNNAIHIQKIEGGDILIIGSASLVHDICRPYEKKTGKSHFGKEALEIIKNVLYKSNIPEIKIKSILDMVELHDVYDWSQKTKKSIELQIVQDADNLDALGAIGIGRQFMYGGANTIPMYIPDENLKFTKDYVENPNDKTSVIAHFYDKLLKLKDNMNTNMGVKIAKQRHLIMEKFLKQFFDEWNSKFGE